MTGFGRGESVENGRHITAEIKSVNHRYLDLSIRMPKKLNCFDGAIRQLVKQNALRGKLDINIMVTDETEDASAIKYNPEIAREYYKYLSQMASDLGITDDISVSYIARMPDVFVIEEPEEDQDKTWELLSAAITSALNALSESRIQEGLHLKKDILEKLDLLSELTKGVEERSPELIASYKKKLKDKLDEVLEDRNVSEQILAAELILYADKVCVDEETVRLKTHIANMKAALEDGENVGRKLDFIAQEMNREANTTLSKANDVTISDIAVNMKTEIEKIREQIQNIE